MKTVGAGARNDEAGDECLKKDLVIGLEPISVVQSAPPQLTRSTEIGS